MLVATYVTFGLAVLCGAYLVAVAGPQLIAVGAASILAGVLYTGGPRPYGYEGLGELFEALAPYIAENGSDVHIPLLLAAAFEISFSLATVLSAAADIAPAKNSHSTMPETAKGA